MDLIVNMPLGKASFYDERATRRDAKQCSDIYDDDGRKRRRERD
jgi:hypothetical protein